MSGNDLTRACQWTHERIDSYLDGGLDFADRARIEAHLDGCALCAGVLDEARTILAALRDLPRQSCPDAVADRVMAAVDREPPQVTGARYAGTPNPLRRWLGSGWLRPALAGTLAIVLLAWAIDAGRRGLTPTPAPDHYTAEEITEAEEALKWTVAYLSNLGARSGEAVRDEVFTGGVVRPVERAVRATFESESVTTPNRDGGSI